MKDYSYELLDLWKKYDGNTRAALEGETSPQCLLAFSPLRENLFEWVEFTKEDRVLQIGSDYGAYTGILAERAGEVVVLDALDENLEVNRLRHGEKGNVRYVRGDLRDGGLGAASSWKEYKPAAGARGTVSELMETPFDYVVMGGFLGQCEREEAAGVLMAAAEALKSGGELLAAAENGAGVRYWMGAKPIGTAFWEADFRELFQVLEEKYGGSFLLYYPVPDYRYPVTLYSDAYLPNTGDVSNISARLDGPGFWFGNEEEVMTKACQNGVFTKFANSFLGAYRKG